MATAMRELCLDLNIDSDNLSKPEPLVELEGYELLIRDAEITQIRRAMTEDNYYDKRIKYVNPQTIQLTEKQFINDEWTNMNIEFTDEPLGVNMRSVVASVPYFTETGGYVNVPTREVSDKLKQEELAERV